jgi:hypothetical protein
MDDHGADERVLIGEVVATPCRYMSSAAAATMRARVARPLGVAGVGVGVVASIRRSLERRLDH